MKRRSQEEETWAKHHQPVSGSGSVPCRLYTDEDPATTIKGLGFKDAATARTTIRLSGQPGSLYKQFWTIKAMAERARHHPHQTTGIKAALKIFDEWLAARAATTTAAAVTTALAAPPPALFRPAAVAAESPREALQLDGAQGFLHLPGGARQSKPAEGEDHHLGLRGQQLLEGARGRLAPDPARQHRHLVGS